MSKKLICAVCVLAAVAVAGVTLQTETFDGFKPGNYKAGITSLVGFSVVAESGPLTVVPASRNGFDGNVVVGKGTLLITFDGAPVRVGVLSISGVTTCETANGFVITWPNGIEMTNKLADGDTYVSCTATGMIDNVSVE